MVIDIRCISFTHIFQLVLNRALVLMGKRNHPVLTTEKEIGLLTEEIYHFRGAVAPVAFTLFRRRRKTQVTILKEILASKSFFFVFCL